MARFGPDRRLIALAVGALLAAGCFGGAPAADSGLSAERRAALARVVVENRTALRLDIAFRYATSQGGEVGIGTVAAGETLELAPVPAGEPIIFLARGPGFERRLSPRSLEIGELWTWAIDPDAPTHGR